MSLVRVHGQLRNLNWRPSRPNQNAKIWQPKRRMVKPPAFIDPLDLNTPLAIWDQGQLGSCTAHGTGFVFAYRIWKTHGIMFMPARLFIYYCERMIEGDVDQDAGAQVSDGLDSLLKYGCPPESEWPYDISQFATEPPQTCWIDGLKEVGLEKNAVQCTVDMIRQSLLADLPVTLGFTVFASFMNQSVADTGVMPMPKDGEEVEGGHCVAVVAYNDDNKTFTCRNSWGASWGKAGRFTIPYDFLSNCSDAWNLPKVA